MCALVFEIPCSVVTIIWLAWSCSINPFYLPIPFRHTHWMDSMSSWRCRNSANSFRRHQLQGVSVSTVIMEVVSTFKNLNKSAFCRIETDVNMKIICTFWWWQGYRPGWSTPGSRSDLFRSTDPNPTKIPESALLVDNALIDSSWSGSVFGVSDTESDLVVFLAGCIRIFSRSEYDPIKIHPDP